MDSKEIGPLYFSQDHYDGFMILYEIEKQRVRDKFDSFSVKFQRKTDRYNCYSFVSFY